MLHKWERHFVIGAYFLFKCSQIIEIAIKDQCKCYNIFQLGSSDRVLLCTLEEKWLALGLPIERLQEIWMIGNYGVDVRWLYFFALAATQVEAVSPCIFLDSFRNTQLIA